MSKLAIFNEAYLAEAGISWHGKSFLSKEEKSNPKFRKEQYHKVMKIVNSAIESPGFQKNFTAIPFICKYKDSDDDAQYCLGRWISGHDKVLGIASFKKEDFESGVSEDSANFIIKYFAKAKSNDKNIFGNLKISKYDGALDYHL